MSKSFAVKVHGKALRVVLLDSEDEVLAKWDRLFGKAVSASGGADCNDCNVSAFWIPPALDRQEVSLGTIFLPRKHPRLIDYTIHECTHAAIAQARILGAESLDGSAEEHIAILAGALSSRVLAKLPAAL